MKRKVFCYLIVLLGLLGSAMAPSFEGPYRVEYIEANGPDWRRIDAGTYDADYRSGSCRAQSHVRVYPDEFLMTATCEL